uniref:Uncharacterized protein n=1 Tax=Timema douglasi TaxID=61478 RepID=A0A7R8ZGT1_TIMDO|nr:unnamed protein product [Timema douglasi]
MKGYWFVKVVGVGVKMVAIHSLSECSCGGILGACSAAYMSRGKFRPVSHVILYDMSLRQQEQLAVSLQRVVSDFRVDDVAVLLPLLLSNSSCQAAILRQVVLFLQSEMNMQIID